MANTDLPEAFHRIYEGPVDDSTVFNSTAELNNYLSNPARYAGQVVSLVEGSLVTIYRLSADKTSWENFSDPSLGYIAENVANKNQANGYAGLDSTGKVPEAQLPNTVLNVDGGQF